MGRHSAADDDDDELAAALVPDTTPIVPIAPIPGRVPAPGPVPGAASGAASGAGSGAEPAQEPGPAGSGRTGSATGADLRLLRERPGLRARCAAAVVVPFVLYTVALVVLSRTDVYLVWVWIPTVLAGVLVGHLLDCAHKASDQT